MATHAIDAGAGKQCRRCNACLSDTAVVAAGEVPERNFTGNLNPRRLHISRAKLDNIVPHLAASRLCRRYLETSRLSSSPSRPQRAWLLQKSCSIASW